jgi:hypothetical protein
MSMASFRDLVISVFGLVATGALIFLGVLAYSFYKRTKPILKSVEICSKNIEDISSRISEVIKPVLQAMAVFQGMRQGIDAISKLFRKH